MRGTFTYFTVEQISTPRSGLVQAIRDCWWPITPDGKVAIYKLRPNDTEHPQCNSNKSIAERVGIPDGTPTAGVVLIPLAFTDHRCEGF